ncbi:MAG TPA: hypothetical protein VL354_00850, partial [Spirochaetia bacterium]|nr:hypothetical protein [Spirochaetia bacterium]
MVVRQAQKLQFLIVLFVTVSSFAHADIIYAATRAGLSISADGGQHWSNDASVLGGVPGNWVSGVHAIDSTTFVSTWTNGILIGGGTVWIGISSPVISKNVGSIYAAGNDVYACTLEGLWISTNDGTNWTQSLAHAVVNRVTTAGHTIYAATNGAGLAVSNDGGTSWKSYLGTDGVADVAVSGTTIYVAT